MKAVNTQKWPTLALLEGSLVVSCQASPGEPLCSPEHISALSLSALNGGAAALRLEGKENIQAVRKLTKVPIIGLIKSDLVAEANRATSVYITSTFAEARLIADAGADIIAIDATQRPRPDGSSVVELIARIHKELGKPVWADISTFAEGLFAAESGADAVSTTLSGYTEETAKTSPDGPDLELLKSLCDKLPLPVILEGKVWHPQEVQEAFTLGAYAVVVGSAITRPQLITRRFVQVTPLSKSSTRTFN